jgi:hypothetical protein
MITLPKAKSAPSLVNPRSLLLYGLALTGKTTFCTKLPEPYLIIDLDGSAGFYECCRTEPVKNFMEFFEVLTALEKSPGAYKYVVLDSISTFEKLVIDQVKVIHNASVEPKYQVQHAFDIPYSGYTKVYEMFMTFVNRIKRTASFIIFVGHAKWKWDTETTKIFNVEAKKAEVKSVMTEDIPKVLDLTGKLADIFLKTIDAAGLMYKDKNGKVKLTFEADVDRYASRCEHLIGKTFEPDWNKIYLNSAI